MTKTRLFALVLFVLPLILGVLFLIISQGNLSAMLDSYYATPSRTCREGYHEEMTPNEVAHLLNIPLVEFTWLPDTLQVTPRIRPYGLIHLDDSGEITCVIQIEYENIHDNSENYSTVIDARILLIASRDAASHSISCYESPESGYRTMCWRDLVTPQGLVRVQVALQYPLDVSEKIIEAIQVASTSD